MRMQAFELAWPKVAIAALLLMAALGALTGSRIRAMRRACAEAEGINSQLLGRPRDPLLKVSLGIRVAVFFGIVLLMAAKPGFWESISIVFGSAVLGLLLSLLVWRSSGAFAAPSADLGS
jgi:hypothetical protein